MDLLVTAASPYYNQHCISSIRGRPPLHSSLPGLAQNRARIRLVLLHLIFEGNESMGGLECNSPETEQVWVDCVLEV